MERGPRGPEISRETQELLKNPEQVFDSDLEGADRQNKEVISRLVRVGEIERSNDHVDFETIEMGSGSAPRIQIVWPVSSGQAYFLNLVPITEGRGIEREIFGYSGEYGLASGNRGRYKLIERISLTELFAVPDDLNIIIQPTINRWAVETVENPLTTAIFGKNSRKMYIGLGFLLLGREWMHIGMHEAGHLPENHDENLAWQIANEKYAELHRGIKTDIISGKRSGRFGLLKKKQESRYYGETPRLGDIVKYGLVSHARANNAKVPAQWDKDQISSDFRRILTAADEAYDNFIGR